MRSEGLGEVDKQIRQQTIRCTIPMKKKFFLLVMLLTGSFIMYAGNVKTTTKVYFRLCITGRENIICTLPRGTVLEVIDMGVSYGRWTVVRYKGKVGFVLTKKVKAVDS
jgi:hypothetical protein